MTRTFSTLAYGQIPGWFDPDTYFANKLAAMRATDPTYTAQRLTAAFDASGFFGSAGAYRHFIQFGSDEEIAPNALFDADQYYVAKTASYYGRQTITENEIQTVKQLIHQAGMNAWTHYVAFGADEGVDPSNSFDSQAYLAAKLAAIHQTHTNATLDDLAAVIRNQGMTPLSHYLCFGKDEGFIRDISQLTVTTPIIVTPKEMPTIELSGYQPHTLLRADFPAGTGEGRVTLNSVTTHKGLSVSNVSHLNLHLSGSNILLEDDTPYDDAVFGTGLSTITLTGTAGASLTVEGVSATTVNASALSGSLVISLSENHATTVIGSQGNDIIETDGMADIMTGGPGNDRFRLGEDLDGSFTAFSLSRTPTITDFSAGDRIDFSEAAYRLQGFASRGQVTASTEADLVNVIRNYLSEAETGILVVHQGGHTYLAANGDGRDTDDDLVVRLVGTYDQSELFVSGYEVGVVS